MANKFVRGALVSFTQTFLLPVPNVIVFQFNPDTMTHSWTPAQAAPENQNQGDPLAVKGKPGEAFSFSLVVDANEMIATGGSAVEAIVRLSGITTQLAALEMLLFPVKTSGGDGLLGSLTASIGGGGLSLGGGASGETKKPLPEAKLPTVLFVWGPGRIVPVRLTGLSITEKEYDSLLNPTHAEAKVDMRVLTDEELAKASGPLAEVAKMGYDYTQKVRELAAIANLVNAAESVIGMLPFS